MLKTYPGKDGLTRKVDLRTENGIVTRPIQRLNPLELMEHSAEEEPGNGTSAQQPATPADNNVDQPPEELQRQKTRAGATSTSPNN